MKRKEPALSWTVDYGAARAHAIRWLGDRYLLAKPINASRYGARLPTPGIFLSTHAEEASPRRPQDED
jgi:hypothetical protein